MKLAFSQPTASPAEEERLLACYRDSGYEGLQLKQPQYLHYLDDPTAARVAAETDPRRFSGLIFGGGLDAEGQMALQRVIDFASSVGSELVVFVHAQPRSTVTPDDIRPFADILARIGDQGQERGVKLSLHNHLNSPEMYSEDLRVFFDRAGRGRVGLTLDTAHLYLAGHDDVGAALLEFADFIDNIHLKDYDADAPRFPTGVQEFTLASNPFATLGNGAIDFDPIFTALVRSGYDGWVCVDEESGADVKESLRSSHEFLLGHFRSTPLERAT